MKITRTGHTSFESGAFSSGFIGRGSCIGTTCRGAARVRKAAEKDDGGQPKGARGAQAFSGHAEDGLDSTASLLDEPVLLPGQLEPGLHHRGVWGVFLGGSLLPLAPGCPAPHRLGPGLLVGSAQVDDGFQQGGNVVDALLRVGPLGFVVTMAMQWSRMLRLRRS